VDLPNGIFKHNFEIDAAGIESKSRVQVKPRQEQGCQMVYLDTKHTTSGKVGMENNGIFFVHMVYFMAIWYIFPRFGMLYHEKSGNPGQETKQPKYFLCVFSTSKSGRDEGAHSGNNVSKKTFPKTL
jgi:hypothetical protein